MAYTTIDDPEAYFQTKIWAGTGSAHSQTFDGDTDMQPDLVWIKNREVSTNHEVADSVRGVNKLLKPNDTDAEQSLTTKITAFNSDGFSVGTDANVNQSAKDQVAWCWKESATAGFDIVAYTGNGTDDTDISHSLSAVPKMIIVKNRDATDAWQVYHAGNTTAPETDYLVLDTSAATSDAADRWSDEAPTSSVFTLGDGVEVNTNTEDYIAYLFRDVQGFSKFGSYTGNADADGTFVYTGFRLAFILFKRTDSTSEWSIFDTKRNTYNIVNHHLYADLPNAEGDDDDFDITANGFKHRRDSNVNKAGTYIYMAFAEAPFVNSNGVPNNAR